MIFARPVGVGCAMAAGACLTGAGLTAAARCESRGISPGITLELRKFRSGEAEMRQRWEEEEEGWHRLPPRAWPAHQPKAEEVTAVQELADRHCTEADASPSCIQAAFDLSTCLIFNGIDPELGLRRFVPPNSTPNLTAWLPHLIHPTASS